MGSSLQESFDTVSDFLLNPKHRYKNWSQLMQEFKASGGQRIGSGRYGQVFTHPKWPYVLKTFQKDAFYTSFVRFAYRNPHPGLPKFYGQPQKIVPFYRRSVDMPTMYLVRMEKLKPISKEIFKEIDFWSRHTYRYFYLLQRNELQQAMQDEVDDRWNRRNGYDFKSIHRMMQEKPYLKNVLEALYIINSSHLQGTPDMHENNFMQRDNGEIVVIDPLWEGSNPYTDAQYAMDMERDDRADLPPPVEDLVGGKLPKRKRPKPFKPQPYNSSEDDDNVPF